MSCIGGTTYCVLASLVLSGKLLSIPYLDRTLNWLVHRLVPLPASSLDKEDYEDLDDEAFLRNLENGKEVISGFQGRPEKDPDACYSFWIGASIRVSETSI